MTPAVLAAKKAGIDFNLHEYPHDANASSYGEEAAALLNLNPSQVFKTLLLESNEKKLAVAILPVDKKLSLKAAARALDVKKTSMANPSDAEKSTGYVLGGISPLGQKKRLPFVIDCSANDFASIYVSAGRRGLEIELSPTDLITLCHARVSRITL